ncbi:MAG: RNase P subunit p30 family protein [Candidatus Hodarchaeota archaeon]
MERVPLKRKFIDVAVLFTKEDDFQEICEMAVELGYYGLCVEGLQKQAVIQNVIDSYPIKIWSRKTLKGSISKIKDALGQERRMHHLISILAEKPDLAKWAAKDQRVDSIMVPLTSVGDVFDPTLAKLAALNGKALEIHFQEISDAIWSRRTSLLRNLYNAASKARQRSCKILFGSGASKIVHLRAPRDMAALLNVIGLGYEEALEIIDDVPLKILQKNELRLSPGFIAPGTRIIEMEEEKNSRSK